MPRLDDHPTVRAVRERTPLPHHDAPLDVVWLRQLCLDAGADDVGFVEMERPELAGERVHFGPVPADEDADQLRLPDEPRADTARTALGGE